MKSVMRFDLRW
jgi:hypothetical protein